MALEKPTMADANLMIQIARWHTEVGVSELLDWFFTDEPPKDYKKFREKYPDGTQEHTNLFKLLAFFETVSTLWKHQLFSQELLFDWLGLNSVWEQIKGLAIGHREARNVPQLWENFEAAAKAQAQNS